jgi:hypothetical protein
VRIASRFVVCATLLLASPRSVRCAEILGACSCVTNGETFAESIAAFASGSRSPAMQRAGAYLDVTLRSETDQTAPDSVGLFPPRRFNPYATRSVWRFTVHRAWAVARPRTRPRSLTLYGPTQHPCPEPEWKLGKRYLVFTYQDGDTVCYQSACASAQSVDSLDTRVGIRALDSLLRRY